MAVTRSASGRSSTGRVDTRVSRKVHATTDEPLWSEIVACAPGTGTRGVVPSGYSVVSTTDAGKALSARKPANSVSTALLSLTVATVGYLSGG